MLHINPGPRLKYVMHGGFHPLLTITLVSDGEPTFSQPNGQSTTIHKPTPVKLQILPKIPARTQQQLKNPITKPPPFPLTFSPPNHHDHRHTFPPLSSTPHQKTPNPNDHRPSLPLFPQTHTNFTQFHLQTPTKKVHSQSRRRRRRWRARWLWHGRGRSGGTGQ